MISKVVSWLTLAGVLAILGLIGYDILDRKPRDYTRGYDHQKTSAEELGLPPGGRWRCSQQASWAHAGKVCGLAIMTYSDDQRTVIRYYQNGLFKAWTEGTEQ